MPISSSLSGIRTYVVSVVVVVAADAVRVVAADAAATEERTAAPQTRGP